LLICGTLDRASCADARAAMSGELEWEVPAFLPTDVLLDQLPDSALGLLKRDTDSRHLLEARAGAERLMMCDCVPT
jgi:hypothetical protein